jgi:hypothetical protein
VAGPVPDAADSVNQLTLLEAFHAQPAVVAMDTLTVAPTLDTDVAFGLTV